MLIHQFRSVRSSDRFKLVNYLFIKRTILKESFVWKSDYTGHAVCFFFFNAVCFWFIGLHSCHVIFVKTFLAIILQYMLLKFMSTSIAYLNKSVTWYICSTIMFHINYSVRLKWKIKIASAYAEESYCSVRHLQQSQSVRQL